MAGEKVSVTLEPWIVAEAREIVGGDIDLSAFVNDVLQWQLSESPLARVERRGPVAPR
jgi:hypothetical protein